MIIVNKQRKNKNYECVDGSLHFPLPSMNSFNQTKPATFAILLFCAFFRSTFLLYLMSYLVNFYMFFTKWRLFCVSINEIQMYWYIRQVHNTCITFHNYCFNIILIYVHVLVDLLKTIKLVVSSWCVVRSLDISIYT